MPNSEPPIEAWTEWGGDGPPLVFGHANGFPPETYRVLLEELLKTYSVASFAARPLWPGSDPRGIGSWRDLGDDLGSAIDRRRTAPVLGVGHSLGSVLSLFAAAADPRRFSALVLVDPVIFSGLQSLFWGIFKGLGFGNRLSLVQGARRRREVYASLEDVRRSWSAKAVFSTWKPEVFEDYVRSAFVPTTGGGVRLRYPKSWEARVFELTPASVWRDLEQIDLPMLFIRGALSDTFRTNAAARVRRAQPTAEIIEHPATTHFVPMERPREVASLITQWNDSIDG